MCVGEHFCLKKYSRKNPLILINLILETIILFEVRLSLPFLLPNIFKKSSIQVYFLEILKFCKDILKIEDKLRGKSLKLKEINFGSTESLSGLSDERQVS